MRTLTRAQRKSSNAERVPRSTPEVLTFPRVLHLVMIIGATNDTVKDDVKILNQEMPIVIIKLAGNKVKDF